MGLRTTRIQISIPVLTIAAFGLIYNAPKCLGQESQIEMSAKKVNDFLPELVVTATLEFVTSSMSWYSTDTENFTIINPRVPLGRSMSMIRIKFLESPNLCRLKDDLDGGYTCDIRVRCTASNNNINVASRTILFSVKFGGPPIPTNVVGNADGPGAAKITWNASKLANVSQSYKVELFSLALNSRFTSTADTFARLTNLKMNFAYQAKVIMVINGGAFRSGKGRSKTFKTGPRTPDLVEEIQLGQYSSSNNLLSWNSVHYSYRTKHYKINITGNKSYNQTFSDSRNLQLRETDIFNMFKSIIIPLFGGTAYSINISAVNEIGEGPPGVMKIATDVGAPPPAPIQLSQDDVGTLITLGTASNINGEISSYQLISLLNKPNCSARFEDYKTALSSELTSFEPFNSTKKLYFKLGESQLRGTTIRSSLIGTIGLCYRAVSKDLKASKYGPPTRLNVDRYSLREVVFFNHGDLTFTVDLYQSDNPIFDYVQVVVMKLRGKEKPTQYPGRWPSSRLKAYNKTIANANQPYIAAYISKANYTTLRYFTVGDGKSYFRNFIEYKNVPLEGGVYYTIFKRFLSGQKEYTGPWLEPTFIQGTPSKPHVKVTVDSNTTIAVSWTPPDKPNGIISTYEIAYYVVGSMQGSYNVKGTLSSSRSYVLTNLKPYTLYAIKMRASSNGGQHIGDWTDGIKVRTDEGVPSQPRNITALDDGAFALNISWLVPVPQNGVIDRYHVLLEDTSLEQNGYHTVSNETFITIKELTPYTQYKIKVKAYTKGGQIEGLFSDAVEVRTGEYKPSEPNANVTYYTNTTITVSWTPPDKANGIISTYKIMCSAVESFQGKLSVYEKLLKGSSKSHVIQYLKPYTIYVIKMQAFTKEGAYEGAWSDEMKVRTEEGIPSQPRNITALDDGAFALNISWLVPVPQYGVIHRYRVQLEDTSLKQKEYYYTESNETFITIKELTPYTQYKIKIRAYTSKGSFEGPWSRSIDARTAESTPSEPIQVVPNEGGPFSISVTWKVPLKSNGVIHKYEIHVEDRSRVPKQYTFYSNVTFYTIKGLQPYMNYLIKIRAYTKGGELKGPWSDSKQGQTGEYEPTPPRVNDVRTFNDTIAVAWLPPEKPNGFIAKYTVMCSTVKDKSGKPSKYKEDVGSTEIQHLIKGLRPHTLYSVKMRAFTKNGFYVSDWSNEVIVLTEEAAPTQPNNLTAQEDGSFAIKARWQVPTPPNGIIYKYLINLQDNSSVQKNYRTVSNETSINITDLKPYTEYNITVRAYTKGGVLEGPWSRSVKVRTGEYRSLMVDGIYWKPGREVSSAVLAWSPPSTPNGIVRKYKVVLKGSKSYNQTFLQTKNTTVEDAVLSVDVFGDTFYNVKISAINGWGEGGEAIFNFTTPIGVPPTPRIKSMKDDKGQTITLFPVSDINGPISWYELTTLADESNCQKRLSSLQESSKLVIFDDLRSPQDIKVVLGEEKLQGANLSLALIGNHTVCYRAVSKSENITSYGIPGWTSVERRSLPKLPAKSTSKSSGPTFDVELSTFSIPDLQFFQVCVMKLGKNQKPTKGPGHWPPFILTPYIESKTNENQPYIAAEFSIKDFDKLKIFTVGDGKLYSRNKRVKRDVDKAGEFRNAPLQIGANYTLFQRVFKSPTSYFTGPWIPPVFIEEEVPKEQESYLYYYIFATVGALVLLTIIIIVFVCVTKRNSHKRVITKVKKDQNAAISLQNYSYEKTVIPNGHFTSMNNTTAHPTISLRPMIRMTRTNFDYVVANRKIQCREGQCKYEEEFEDIQQECKTRMANESKHERTYENGRGNLYQSISIDKPNEFTVDRASLENKQTECQNAICVKGVKGENAFIATKYPILDTVDDFWVMILQERITKVVILSDLDEFDKDEEGPCTFLKTFGIPLVRHGIQITAEEEIYHDTCVEINISLKEDEKDGNYKCKFFHFFSWPDHSVPATTSSIVQLASKVKVTETGSRSKSPIAIVCSDGAGRSGSLITILMAIDCLATKGFCDIKQIVKGLRDARPQFVENANQYLFCYEAVAAYLQRESSQGSHKTFHIDKYYENLGLEE